MVEFDLTAPTVGTGEKGFSRFGRGTVGSGGLINYFPKFDGRFIDDLSVLHSEMVGCVPPQTVDHGVAVKEGNLDLFFFGNDFTEQYRLMRWLLPWMMMFGSLVCHRKASPGHVWEATQRDFVTNSAVTLIIYTY